jgi:hypothetical protein
MGAAHAAPPFPAVFPLSSLDGSNGFVLNGIATNDTSGGTVSAAGDINGDGVGDLLSAAVGADPNGVENAGESYVVFGGPSLGGTGAVDLSTLDGSNGFVLIGTEVDDFSGVAVSGAGDVNGDGYDDLLIGAPDADPNHRHRAGQAYVVFGGPGVGAAGRVELNNLDGANGLTLNGTHYIGQAGIAVGGSGDMNGDGHADVLISAWWADPGARADAGQSYVVLGGPNVASLDGLLLPLLNGSNGFVINGVDIKDYSGSSVRSAGDLNGDGLSDVLIGAMNADPDGKRDAGEVYVVFGSAVSPGAQLELSALDGSNGFVLKGVAFYDNCGLSVSGAGDVNDDGYGDVIVGAPRARPGGDLDRGESYAVFGGPEVGAGGSMDLSALDGANGFVLHGVNEGDLSGFAARGAGDVNGDGIDDLVIGAFNADPGGRTSAGQTYVVYGRPDLGSAGVMELSTLDGENGFVLNGIDVQDYSGSAAAAAGDLNADGVGDLVIGAFGGDPNGVSRAGETYVIFGRAADTDADGVPDRSDNCTRLANADQRDTNADGFGNACDADLNDDGIVNFSDLGLLKGLFFTTDPNADFNGDGVVNFTDLGWMKAFFFQPPGPSGRG